MGSVCSAVQAMEDGSLDGWGAPPPGAHMLFHDERTLGSALPVSVSVAVSALEDGSLEASGTPPAGAHMLFHDERTLGSALMLDADSAVSALEASSLEASGTPPPGAHMLFHDARTLGSALPVAVAVAVSDLEDDSPLPLEIVSSSTAFGGLAGTPALEVTPASPAGMPPAGAHMLFQLAKYSDQVCVAPPIFAVTLLGKPACDWCLRFGAIGETVSTMRTKTAGRQGGIA